MSVVDFIAKLITLLGTPYIYGGKGDICSDSLIDKLANLYPTVYNASYIKAAKSFNGKVVTDCSGLISMCTGIMRGSYQYKETASEVLNINYINNSHVGWALWKPGHIAIYIGDGQCIEAKGINYGTIMSPISSCGFTHILKLCDIEYIEHGWYSSNDGWYFIDSESKNRVIGWNLIEHKWYFFNNDGILQTGWTKYHDNWFYLNKDGSLYHGWLLYKDKWYYLDKEDLMEGKMVTGVAKLKWNGELHDFIFDDNGALITTPVKIYFNDIGAIRHVSEV